MLDGIKYILFDLGGTLKVSGKWEWYPDVEANLERLANNYQLVIAANQPKVTHDFIEQSGLKKYFSKIFLSDVIGKAKPDRVFFEHILEQLHIRAQDVAMVGDSLSHDIAPAKSLGIRTVLLTRGDNANSLLDESGLVAPDFNVTRLEEIK